MTNHQTNYTQVEEDSTAVLDYEKELEYEEEKWINRLWISQTLGGHYKLFIKTEVVNKNTEKSRSRKSHSILLRERGWIAQNVFGKKRFKKKELAPIQDNIDYQVKKLAEANKTMKSEEELLDEISDEFEKQLQDIDFEGKVEEVKNQ